MSTRRPANRAPVRRRPKVAGTARPGRERPATTVDPIVADSRAQADGPGSVSVVRRLVAAFAGLRGRLRGRRVSALWLGIAAVLLAAFAVLAAFRPGATPDNQAFVDTSTTAEVKAAAKHALTTLKQHKAAEMGGFKAAAKTVMTDGMYKVFDKTADSSISLIEQARLDTQAEVDPIGVIRLDGDRAELLLHMVVNGSRGGQVDPNAGGDETMVVRMEKTGGHWLISDIPDLPA